MIAPRTTHRDVTTRLGWSLVFILGMAAGCNEETTQPEDDSLVLPAPTTPENVVAGMQVIYNDRTHSAIERRQAYENLLSDGLGPPAEAFIFNFQPSDIINGLPPSWGRDAEVAAHRAIFDAQEAGDIYSLELRITHDPAGPLTPPEDGREGWQQVFATNVYLRIMFNTDDGLEVNGAQALFEFPPAHDGAYRIARWTDLPRPGAARESVEPTTWGSIKAGYAH